MAKIYTGTIVRNGAIANANGYVLDLSGGYATVYYISGGSRKRISTKRSVTFTDSSSGVSYKIKGGKSQSISGKSQSSCDTCEECPCPSATTPSGGSFFNPFFFSNKINNLEDELCSVVEWISHYQICNSPFIVIPFSEESNEARLIPWGNGIINTFAPACANVIITGQHDNDTIVRFCYDTEFSNLLLVAARFNLLYNSNQEIPFVVRICLQIIDGEEVIESCCEERYDGSPGNPLLCGTVVLPFYLVTNIYNIQHSQSVCVQAAIRIDIDNEGFDPPEDVFILRNRSIDFYRLPLADNDSTV